MKRPEDVVTVICVRVAPKIAAALDAAKQTEMRSRSAQAARYIRDGLIRDGYYEPITQPQTIRARADGRASQGRPLRDR